MVLASDGEAGDLFGHAVALDGKLLVVGALREDKLGDSAGASYVLTRPDLIMGGVVRVGDPYSDTKVTTGNSQVTIPAGAVPTDTRHFQIRVRSTPSVCGSAPSGQTLRECLSVEIFDLYGNAVSFENVTLNDGVTVTFVRPSGSSITVRKRSSSGESWRVIPRCTTGSAGECYTIDGNTIEVSGITSFSQYAVTVPQPVVEPPPVTQGPTTGRRRRSGGGGGGAIVPPVSGRPAAQGFIADPTLDVGGAPLVVSLSDKFKDPDNQALTYTVLASKPAVATAQVINGNVVITPLGPGKTRITITATDTDGQVGLQVFVVTVEGAVVVPPVITPTPGADRPTLTPPPPTPMPMTPTPEMPEPILQGPTPTSPPPPATPTAVPSPTEPPPAVVPTPVPPAPPVTPPPPSGGFPLWLIVVLIVGGSVLLIGLFLLLRRR